MNLNISPGSPYPFGATVVDDGINFAVFSHNATAIYLELFDAPDDGRPRASLALDPVTHRTGDVWHLFVHGLKCGQLYGFRADGPYDPLGRGHRFNVNKLLADPYARAVEGHFDLDHDATYGYDRASSLADLSYSALDSAPHAAKCVALAAEPFDWQGTRPLRRPLAETVIYETHVRGLTAHASSGVEHPGTYLGVVEKIPHFLQLGVTAVELLPVHEFNEGEPVGFDPVTGKRLRNYWGYNTLCFFGPEKTYATDPRGGRQVREFRRMVRALHQAGIEVILDVVFNHTGEGHELGPTLNFRGLDNAIYYMLDNGRRYRNYSGCGNTLNCNHPVVKRYILQCLRHWAVEMHVDGFRFDLATILGRDRRGEWIGDRGLLMDIGGDPVLRGTKLIAESWDAEGMYKVGGFPRIWAEWNGRFRDDVRGFVRGDDGMATATARRLGGSRDLFGEKVTPAQSIDFVTCHDGFTLRDLVSYERKHNRRNGEDNRDGSDHEQSSNHGVEGETDDPAIRRTRLRQAKNLLVLLFVGRGTPMLRGGDELWQTKAGNNNTYCQDNELSWLDWEAGDESRQMHRFVRELVALRRQHPALMRPTFVDPAGQPNSHGEGISWHGVRLKRPDWDYHSHTLALQVHGCPAMDGTDDLYIVCSAWSEPLDFELPPLPKGVQWHRLVDTGMTSPDDIVPVQASTPHRRAHYSVQPTSAVVLVAR